MDLWGRGGFGGLFQLDLVLQWIGILDLARSRGIWRAGTLAGLRVVICSFPECCLVFDSLNAGPGNWIAQPLHALPQAH